MAPPTAALRLATLSPDNVAREVVDAVRQHIERLGVRLGPGVEVELHGVRAPTAPVRPRDLPRATLGGPWRLPMARMQEIDALLSRADGSHK